MERTARCAKDAAYDDATPWRQPPDLEIFDAPGARLDGITQKTAHTAIRLARASKTPARRRTEENIAKIKAAVRVQNERTPTEDQIWTATKAKLLARNVRNFIWKGIHGGHKIGSYFAHMPAPWCDYAKCPLCGTSEDLQHILFECTSPEATSIWQIAAAFMEPRIEQWPDLSVGAIMGCALLEFRDEEGRTDDGLTRVMRIVISESAFLIWKIRCERRIEHEDDQEKAPTVDEITGRWHATINARISHDRHLTNKRRYKRKALDEDLVLETWEDLLEKPEGLPRNWIRHPGVLVGRGTTRPRGRER
ncbi:hypothetical protein EXIGLDRAFT_602731 [Exidia glandulosa HHB12029]|uniref:Reverse transcriptase zinc-binding domain-containing protein n=1 Tax=Exidia glandulosa HHB12029 TaxID=1314781 RepID=A0A165P3Z4_EXIGL|nr:hypothetical protein EXIGLDRAFT_602731 [Exidia glandulosa HHB12029]